MTFNIILLGKAFSNKNIEYKIYQIKYRKITVKIINIKIIKYFFIK